MFLFFTSFSLEGAFTWSFKCNPFKRKAHKPTRSPLHNPFTEVNLEDINRAADIIIDNTTPSDTLIFLGRTPLYVLEALRAKGVPRRVHTVAFSGFNDKHPSFVYVHAERSKKRIQNFRDHLTQNRITPEELSTAEGRIVLIDHIHTGRTVGSFLRILKDWTHDKQLPYDEINQRLKVVNLTNKTIHAANPPRLNGIEAVDVYMKISSLHRIRDTSEEEELGLPWSFHQWDDPPLHHHPSETAQRLR